jgi:hypothetical protein
MHVSILMVLTREFVALDLNRDMSFVGRPSPYGDSPLLLVDFKHLRVEIVWGVITRQKGRHSLR